MKKTELTTRKFLILFLLTTGMIVIATLSCDTLPRRAGILDKNTIANQYFGNDSQWFIDNIPFLDCPDDTIQEISYYYWKKSKMHLRNIGDKPDTKANYIMTEMTPLHTWSGPYGGMSMASCPHILEMRWIRDEQYVRDYINYWFTAGQPPDGLFYQFTNWMSTATYDTYLSIGDTAFIKDQYENMKRIYQYWYDTYFNKKYGLFARVQIREGMERSISSRSMIVKDCDALESKDHRVVFNTYMYSDLLTIQKVALMLGKTEEAADYGTRAEELRTSIMNQLWDNDLKFFVVLKEDGSIFRGREIVGYIPWMFNMPGTDTPDHEVAWSQLHDTLGFEARFGPTTAEKRHPYYNYCFYSCTWGGPNWPFTSQQTLYGLANLLRNYSYNNGMTNDDYVRQFQKYARIHYKDGLPYCGESHHVEKDVWKSDIDPRGLHYNLSGYNDILITGLAGLKPREDNIVEVDPLFTSEWKYFCLEDIPYHGHKLTILWDESGERYGKGKGLKVFVNNIVVASGETISKLTGEIPAPERQVVSGEVNLAVNSTGYYKWGEPTDPRPWMGSWIRPVGFPVPDASFTSPEDSLWEANDGSIWYYMKPDAPHNMWSSKGSGNEEDWYAIDFGEVKNGINSVKLYFFGDNQTYGAPKRYRIQYLKEGEWVNATGWVNEPLSNTMSSITFPDIDTKSIRALFTNPDDIATALVEMEVYAN